VKIIGLSVDPVDQHAKWADDIEDTQGLAQQHITLKGELP
jgi:alkyl hydroperoxide reductase subunit AhpC